MTSKHLRTPSNLLFAGCVAFLISLTCLLFLGTAGLILYNYQGAPDFLAAPATTAAPATVPATSTAAPENPLAQDRASTPVPEPTETANPAPALRAPDAIVQQPIPPQSFQQLEALLNADFPVHDFYEASRRLGNEDVGPRTVTAQPYQVGDRQSFFVNEDTVDAVLMAATEHTYFWVEDGLNLDQAAVNQAAQRFEQEYYPPLVNLFGQEWQPGVDNDPHFSVLHLDNLSVGGDELGYFNSGDEFPRTFFRTSNQQEILYLNMRNLTLGSELYFGTLVHEFQHLVQWYLDANETTWLDEGLSQLAEIYVGLETAESVDYLLSPDTPLAAWEQSTDAVYAHYGATYLFAVYLWEQLGEAAVQELARSPANGMAAVDAVLKGFRPQSSLEQFVADWTVANYVDDESAGPQYHYRTLDLSKPTVTTSANFTPFETVQEIRPFGVHYVDLQMAGTTTISFAGDTTTQFIPTTPHSGEQMWFAPAQDGVNAQLTREFDLSGLDEATLTFWTWYDLKFDLDYAYVSVSTDNGNTWELLAPSSGRLGDYGPSFNGRSSTLQRADKAGWVQESFSLDAYAGAPLLIRFELLTYYESGALGFALDDIAVPQLDYATDVEGTVDGWRAAGFVQTGPVLPQKWGLRLIQEGSPVQVLPLTLDDFNQGQWTVELGPEGGVLSLVPLTPFAGEPANYWLHVDQ